VKRGTQIPGVYAQDVKKIVGLRWEKVTGGWRSFIICSIHYTLLINLTPWRFH
jgi:hypothetical protein